MAETSFKSSRAVTLNYSQLMCLKSLHKVDAKLPNICKTIRILSQCQNSLYASLTEIVDNIIHLKAQ